jgi:hypothetical protein
MCFPQVDDINSYPWYFGKASREQVNNLLQQQADEV